MQWRNSATCFGGVAKFFHWTSAASFIAAYIVVYYVIWFMDDTSPESLPVLNIHWVLGLLVGFLVLPRLLWRLLDMQPDNPPGSALEHILAHVAHGGLYGLMIAMPLTGYLGTGAPTDFGLFSMTGFNETKLFAWFSVTFSLSYEAFEAPIDTVHHFLGKWVAWVLVSLHVLAALFHHLVRRDSVLRRMLPWSSLPKAS
ncbi:cytochrome b [Pseudomonas syringae]|uniref:Cytochrome b n=1 Tax=Pseudomonas syringae pv. syringae TaxID=321 RepID=A0AB35JRW3_PSESY|nr:cytochrome b [Pseudomonas syringae]MBI6752704.1 cytochrome b [Pseudomonas syringae]MBI6772885.1 cytochrome b [Pseudomonas syringae]MBI6778453.1 cytochrome b [Pseudomonas syringae]MBI6792619.1 cytochrome b [Pseudomonas syringae]MBI6799892.1 cytochrome b [Pseudomonas syringae]